MKTEDKTKTVRIPEAVYIKIKPIADAEKRSVSGQVTVMLEKELKKQG